MKPHAAAGAASKGCIRRSWRHGSRPRSSGLASRGLAERQTPGRNRRRIKELERELHRKDKALAETAALLVLSKKLLAVFHIGEDV